jgi:hypothetical protein
LLWEADIPELLKASHILPPAAALIGVAIWNLSQWQAVSAQSEQVTSLRDRVVSARNSPAAREDKRTRKITASSADGPIDWKSFAEDLIEMENGGGMKNMKSLIGFQNRVAGMSKEEILAALEEIAGLDLDDEARAMLEEMLVTPLIEQDPALALTTFANRIPDDDDGVAWQLSGALAAWAKIDRAAASAWFDRQIASGLFESKSLDGQSQARMEFEAALVGELLGSDINAAGQRIAALPEDQRREALEQIPFSELSPAAQKAYAELVRSLVPSDERAGSFTHVISDLVSEGGFSDVDRFLDDIGATPEERAVSAREAANTNLEEIASERPVTSEDVDKMRDWLKEQAPGTVDKVTGEAIADAAQDGGEFDFEDASKLALKYHRSSGNDEVLIAFLESFAARSNLEEALPLVDKISNPARRDEILKRLK